MTRLPVLAVAFLASVGTYALVKGEISEKLALRHGAFFHPQHNMFLSAAHGPADIDAALEAAAHGFTAVAELDARMKS